MFKRLARPKDQQPRCPPVNVRAHGGGSVDHDMEEDVHHRRPTTSKGRFYRPVPYATVAGLNDFLDGGSAPDPLSRPSIRTAPHHHHRSGSTGGGGPFGLDVGSRNVGYGAAMPLVDDDGMLWRDQVEKQEFTPLIPAPAHHHRSGGGGFGGSGGGSSGSGGRKQARDTIISGWAQFAPMDLDDPLKAGYESDTTDTTASPRVTQKVINGSPIRCAPPPLHRDSMSSNQTYYPFPQRPVDHPTPFIRQPSPSIPNLPPPTYPTHRRTASSSGRRRAAPSPTPPHSASLQKFPTPPPPSGGLPRASHDSARTMRQEFLNASFTPYTPHVPPPAPPFLVQRRHSQHTPPPFLPYARPPTSNSNNNPPAPNVTHSHVRRPSLGFLNINLLRDASRAENQAKRPAPRATPPPPIKPPSKPPTAKPRVTRKSSLLSLKGALKRGLGIE